MQTPHMQSVLQNSLSASHTNSVEGLLYDPNLPSANLAITSTFFGVHEKCVATMYGILFGKSCKQYQHYFKNLLIDLNYRDIYDFSTNCMGMVCDFSEAERIGFESVLQQIFEVSSESYNLKKFYAICHAHFNRSACRVDSNHAVVPVGHRDNFKDIVQNLKVIEDEYEFDEQILLIKVNFSKCKKWLDWYLHSDHVRIIFPSKGKSGL